VVNYLRKIYHQYLLYRNYRINLRRHHSFIRKMADSPPDNNQKIVAFDVEDDRFMRHLYNFIMFFILSGYRVYLKRNVSYIGNLGLYSDCLLETENLFIVNRLPSNPELKFSTDKKSGFIMLRDDYLSANKAQTQSLTYPFSMHPMIYKDHLYKLTEELRSSSKKMRIFFAGAIELEYCNQNFKNLFKIIDRYTIFQAINERYSKDDLIIITKEEELNILEGDNYLNKIILIKSPGAVHWFYWDKWYPLLAKADFFLALPGIKIPLCHNLVEAMSLGVIPIIQYHKFLPDPLENNVNCVMFNSTQELFERIDEARSMDNSQIMKLKQGVIAYYERYLKPQQIVKRIEKVAESGSLKELYMYAPAVTVNRLKSEINPDATTAI